MLTVFQCISLEGWTDIMYKVSSSALAVPLTFLQSIVLSGSATVMGLSPATRCTLANGEGIHGGKACLLKYFNLWKTCLLPF